VYKKYKSRHLKIHSVGAYIYSWCKRIIWQKEKVISSVSCYKMACLVSYYKMTRIISSVITEMATSLHAIRWRARYNFKHPWECRKIRVLWQSVNSAEGNQVITRLSESVSNGKIEYERRFEIVPGDEGSYAFYEITPCRYQQKNHSGCTFWFVVPYYLVGSSKCRKVILFPCRIHLPDCTLYVVLFYVRESQTAFRRKLGWAMNDKSGRILQ